ncbi:Mut7-C RNAse domain-containing protein [Natrialbaceae archaeon A-CW3]
MNLLIDVMCGGLVSYCRMCGYDTLYAQDRDLEHDDEVLAIASEEGRTVVTRDVELAGRADEAILLESRDVVGQLRALHEAGVELTLPSAPQRCGRCNGVLESIPEGATTPSYAPDSSELAVWCCEACGQHFWKGSHWDRVRRTLAVARGEAPTDTEVDEQHGDDGHDS